MSSGEDEPHETFEGSATALQMFDADQVDARFGGAKGKPRKFSGTGEPMMLGPADRARAYQAFLDMLARSEHIGAAVEQEQRRLMLRFVDVESVVQVRVCLRVHVACEDSSTLSVANNVDASRVTLQR